jgi:hypothetical protein
MLVLEVRPLFMQSLAPNTELLVKWVQVPQVPP